MDPFSLWILAAVAVGALLRHVVSVLYGIDYSRAKDEHVRAKQAHVDFCRDRIRTLEEEKSQLERDLDALRGLLEQMRTAVGDRVYNDTMLTQQSLGGILSELRAELTQRTQEILDLMLSAHDSTDASPSVDISATRRIATLERREADLKQRIQSFESQLTELSETSDRLRGKLQAIQRLAPFGYTSDTGTRRVYLSEDEIINPQKTLYVDFAHPMEMTEIGPYRVCEKWLASEAVARFIVEHPRTGDRAEATVWTRRSEEHSNVLTPLLAELRAAKSVKHRSFFGVLECGGSSVEGVWCIVEPARGRFLREVAPELKGKWARAVELAAGIADALRPAHAKGVVHGHLSTDTVLLTPEGIRIAGLGMGPLHHPGHGARDYGIETDTTWMAPSEWRVTPPPAAGPTLDTWGTASLLYYLLTGRAPFDASALERARRGRRVRPRRIRTSGSRPPRALAMVIRMALDSDDSRRYQSISHLRADLMAAASGQPPTKAWPYGLLERVAGW